MFKVKISVGNDAFQPDAKPECARLCREVAARLDRGETRGNLHDINGNLVGFFRFEV